MFLRWTIELLLKIQKTEVIRVGLICSLSKILSKVSENKLISDSNVLNLAPCFLIFFIVLTVRIKFDSYFTESHLNPQFLACYLF